MTVSLVHAPLLPLPTPPPSTKKGRRSAQIHSPSGPSSSHVPSRTCLGTSLSGSTSQPHGLNLPPHPPPNTSRCSRWPPTFPQAQSHLKCLALRRSPLLHPRKARLYLAPLPISNVQEALAASALAPPRELEARRAANKPPRRLIRTQRSFAWRMTMLLRNRSVK